MSTLQTRAKTSKTPVARSFRILRRPTADQSGRLLITVGNQVDEYDYLMTPHLDGVAIHLFHESGDESRINTTIIAPSGNCCTCKGWEYRGKCKHVAALSVLVQREAQAKQMPATPKAPVCLRCGGKGVIRSKTDGQESVSRCEACDGF